MSRNREEPSEFTPFGWTSTDWEDKMQEAWPHLRAAVWQRVQDGESLLDLAGVVAELPPEEDDDEDEESLSVGVLTREELAETIAENNSAQGKQWIERLRKPAPPGCIYVFGSFGGLPRLWTMGPVAPSTTPN